MDANFRIDGEKIFLTPMTLDDAELFVKWRNSDFIRQYFLVRDEFTVEGEREWIKNKVMTDEVVQFIIWDKADIKKIGSTYLINIDHENHKCEYGILIGEPEYVSGGRGFEANSLIIKYAFEELNMFKVYAQIISTNVRSYKAAMKMGLNMEGIFVADRWIDGKPVDMIHVAAFNRKHWEYSWEKM